MSERMNVKLLYMDRSESGIEKQGQVKRPETIWRIERVDGRR